MRYIMMMLKLYRVLYLGTMNRAIYQNGIYYLNKACVQSRFVTYCVELITWLPIINSYHIEVVSTINSLK